MIGSTLHERYRIDAEMGRGGMAVVYRARDTLLERPVAVKVMSQAPALGTEGRARLLHEIRALPLLADQIGRRELDKIFILWYNREWYDLAET